MPTSPSWPSVGDLVLTDDGFLCKVAALQGIPLRAMAFPVTARGRGRARYFAPERLRWNRLERWWEELQEAA